MSLFVQGTNNDDSASAASIAATYSGAIGVGNFLICFVSWGDTEGTPTCADSVNGAWTAVGTQLWSGNNQGLKAFYLNNTAAGTPVVTVSFGGARAFRGLVIGEYSGIHSTDPINNDLGFREAAVAGSGADNASTIAFTPSASGLTVVAGLIDVDGTLGVAAGTNYTERVDIASAPGENNFMAMNMIDRIGAPSGSQQAFWTITNGAQYHSQAVVLNEEPAAEPPSGPPFIGGRIIYRLSPQRWG
jgi:hypothetical protein